MVALFVGAAVHAQDILVKHDASELEVKVVEVGENQIRYRKYSNLEGPIYTISRS